MSFIIAFQLPEMELLLTTTDRGVQMYSRLSYEISMIILSLVLASINLVDPLLLRVLAVTSSPVLHSSSV